MEDWVTVLIRETLEGWEDPDPHDIACAAADTLFARGELTVEEIDLAVMHLTKAAEEVIG